MLASLTPKLTYLAYPLSRSTLPPLSCAGAARTEYVTATPTPHAPAGAYCELCGTTLAKKVILSWNEREIFKWMHPGCTGMDSQLSFNGPSGAMHAMQATFPGGAAAWDALQAQMKEYAAEKAAAKEKAKAAKE